MDYLPDFSSSKIEIRNRIEGALREKKRKPSIYQYSLFLGFFLFTTVCTALYLKNILLFKGGLLSDASVDYYNLEKLLLSDQLDRDSIIVIPSTLSLVPAGEPTFISYQSSIKGDL